MIRSVCIGAALALAVLTGPVALAQQPEGGANLEAASGVKLRALDKITGNSTDISAKVGQSLNFGRLRVTVRACYQSRPQDAPESAAFIEIRSASAAKEADAVSAATDRRSAKGPQVIGPDGLLFSGWMFASSPGLNALEHPTYDVWVISCSAATP